MTFVLARIQPRRRSASPTEQLIDLYVQRTARYAPCEAREFGSESDLLAFLERAARRTRPALVVADSSGDALTSEQFARRLGGFAEAGIQTTVVAVGPADGWSAGTLAGANLRVAFGRITLPHELAAVILAEQLYRAQTILAGHPYHSGH